MSKTPQIKKIDAWEVNGKFFPIESQAKEAQQAYRLENLLKDVLETNLNEQERNTIGWMLLNRLTELKYLINQLENVLMKDKDFADFLDGLKERAKQIEQASLDQQAEADEKKEKLLKQFKAAGQGKQIDDAEIVE